MTETIEKVIKQYILDEFLAGEDPEALTNETPLITGGILDSLATIKLVAFLDEKYNIQIQAHETSLDYLNSISDISKLVQSKIQ